MLKNCVKYYETKDEKETQKKKKEERRKGSPQNQSERVRAK